MKTNYVLIDLENVTPEHLEKLKADIFKVYLFIGKSQTKIPVSVAQSMQGFGERGQYVLISGTGPNALDFHIAYYIGRIAEHDPNAYFHIVSQDKGFDPLIEHLKSNHIFADRVEKIENIPLLSLDPEELSHEERINIATRRLLQPNATRPRQRKTLANHLMAMFNKGLSDKEVDEIANALIQKGVIREKDKRITYSDEKN